MPATRLIRAAPLARLRPLAEFPATRALPAPDRHIFYDGASPTSNSVSELGGSWASEAYVTRSILAGLFGRTRAA